MTTSFYRRPLPEGLVPFASDEGRAVFREALEAGTMEGFFALAEQFHTQAEPAFCGLGSLVVALNALGVDPGRAWKGPWRWFGEEMLDCCVSLEEVRSVGLTLDEVGCLARCNGARARVRRADAAPVGELRAAVLAASRRARGEVVVASYSRASLGQTGSGHFSPVGGLHVGRDLALLLDVARFKYPPHWVPVERLHGAMCTTDEVTGRSRGWVVLEGGGRPMAALAAFRPDASWRPLVLELARVTPRALDGRAAADGAGAARAVLEAVPERFMDTLSLVEATVPTDPPELGEAVARARAALERTRARGLVDAAGPPFAGRAALAALLLALPERVIAPLSGAGRAELDAARAEPLDPLLAHEIGLLRDQLAALVEHACC